jgi:Mg-chelatase subunit ChlD
MAQLAQSLLLYSAIVAISGSLQAQKANEQTTQSLIVNVLDRHGNAVRDLTKENFRLRIRGRPVSVLDAQYSLAPRRMVVLVDTSGSMAGNFDNKKWTIARDAVEELLALTPPDVALALLTFSKNVQVKADFAKGRPAIADWLREGPSQPGNLKGQTALFDAVSAGLKLLEPVRHGDAIYAVTDGGDNNSHTSKNQAEAALLKSGVRLFVFLFSEPAPVEEMRVGVDSTVELAGNTGGFVFGTPAISVRGSVYGSLNFLYDYNSRTRERIKLYTQMLNIQLNGFYTLQVAEPSHKRARVSLDIVDNEGRGRRDVAFTFPRVFVPVHY